MGQKILEDMARIEPQISEKGEIFFPISMTTVELEVFLIKAMQFL